MLLRIMVVSITRREHKSNGLRHKTDLTPLARAEQVIAEGHRP